MASFAAVFVLGLGNLCSGAAGELRHAAPIVVVSQRAEQQPARATAFAQSNEMEETVILTAEALEWALLSAMALLAVLELMVIVTSTRLKCTRKCQLELCLLLSVVGALMWIAGLIIPLKWLGPVGRVVVSSGHGTKSLAEVSRHVHRLLRFLRN